MTVKTIIFEQCYPTGQFSNQRLRVEISLEKEDFEPKVIPDRKVGEPLYEIPDPSQVIQKYFAYAKQLVNDAFEKMNPQIKWAESLATHSESGSPTTHYFNGLQVTYPISPTESVDKRVQAIIEDINQCTAIDEKNHLQIQIGLIAYEDAANQNPIIKASYDLKMKQLKG